MMSTKTFSSFIGLLGLVSLAVAIIYLVVNNDFNLTARILLGAGVVGLAFYAWMNPDSLKEVFLGSKARYGSNTLAAILIFVAIVGFINFFAAKNNQRWDATADKSYTLSDQTVKIVGAIRDPIKVMAFMRPGDYGRDQAEALLKEMTTKTDKISYEFIDPDLNPTTAIQFQADYGSLIFQSGTRKQTVTAFDESNFASAILRLSTDNQKKVSFVTGHGERDVTSSQADGYSYAKQILSSNNFEVSSVNFTTSVTGTQDIDVLVIADPETALLDAEKKVLEDYMARGGNLLFLTDARTKAPIDEYLAKYGIETGQGVVVDPGSSSINDVAMLAIQRFIDHPITKNTRAMIVLPYATAFNKPKIPSPGATVSTLAESTERSWLETDLKAVQFDDGKDAMGPLPLAIAIESNTGRGDENKKERVVVVGDADFASNQFVQNVGNSDFLANSINWLTDSEEMITISSKTPQDRSVFLTGSQKNGIMLSTIVLLPLTVLGFGGVVWWRRR